MEYQQTLGRQTRNLRDIDLAFDSEGMLTLKIDGNHYPVHVFNNGHVQAEIEVDAVVINAIGMIGSVTYGAVSPIVEFQCHGSASLDHGLLSTAQRCYVHSCRRVSVNRKVLILRRLVNAINVKSK